MEIDPIDFFPGCDPYYCVRRRPSRCSCLTICTHLLAMIFAVAICAGAFYYYNIYINNYKSFFGDDGLGIWNSSKSNKIDRIKQDMEKLKKDIQKTNVWRKHLDELFSKIYLEQEAVIEKKIEKAIDLYDADKVGLFDYASVYACGSVIAIPGTIPYPANKSISFFFNILNVDIMSNPEQILHPNNLPGNCFAFYGTTGRIRIKLGSKIAIKAVTLDHIKLVEDTSSAPKDFEVYGLENPFDVKGVFLGKFVYKLEGRSYQTFNITEPSKGKLFEYVELYILSNHGRRDFTCVYRFRVHNAYLQ